MKKNIYMSKFKITQCIILFIFFLITPQISKASEINLSLTPSVLEIHAKPGEEITKNLTLINNGSDPISIQVQIRPFIPLDKNGQIQLIKETLLSIENQKLIKIPKITINGITSENFTINPKQKKPISLWITLPQDQSPTDLYFSVIFIGSALNPSADTSLTSILDTDQNIEEKPEYQNYSYLKSGLATNILLVAGKSTQEGYIEEFSSPKFTQSGPVNFMLKVANNGATLISPTGYIEISNFFGQTIGKIDIKKTTILSQSTRNLSGPTSDPKETNLIWPEKFLLGRYKASLTLKIAENNPPLKKTITFWALPVHFIIIIIILILISIAIVTRLIYRLKTD